MPTARVLVVDDSMFMRRVLKETLARAGHEVVEADTGERALEEYGNVRPDVVTLDLVMPGMGGLETLRRLRAAAPEARVVVVSAVGQDEEVRRARELGATDFVLKPFDEAAVVAKVRAAMEGR